MSVPICEPQMSFYPLFGFYYWIQQLLSVLIVVQSLIARTLFIYMSDIIKFTSNSQRMSFIIVSVFAIYFLQYGVLYLFAPMNLNYPIISQFVTGVYEDFNQYWYADIGA